MINAVIADWIRNNSENEEKLNQFINNRKVLIWGAFEQGKYVYDFIKDKCNVVGFVDSKKKENFLEKPVYSSNILSEKRAEEYCIIIALYGYRHLVIV